MRQSTTVFNIKIKTGRNSEEVETAENSPVNQPEKRYCSNQERTAHGWFRRKSVVACTCSELGYTSRRFHAASHRISPLRYKVSLRVVEIMGRLGNVLLVGLGERSRVPLAENVFATSNNLFPHPSLLFHSWKGPDRVHAREYLCNSRPREALHCTVKQQPFPANGSWDCSVLFVSLPPIYILTFVSRSENLASPSITIPSSFQPSLNLLSHDSRSITSLLSPHYRSTQELASP